jgi:predicted transposase YdaD
MIPTPHDALFKSVFSKPENVVGELSEALPEGVVTKLDFGTLTLESGSFVDSELQERHSDLLFSINLRGQERRAFVYVLFEHQSTDRPHEYLAFRLLRCQVRIWEQHLKQNPGIRRLPIIVSLVLYHGQTEWRSPLRFHDLMNADEDELATFGEFVPQFRFVIDDVGHTADEALRTRGMSTHARLALWFLKAARDSAQILKNAAFWGELLRELLTQPSGAEAMAVLLRYYLLVTDAPSPDTARRVFREAAGPHAEEIYVTLAESLINQGKLEGKTLGIAEGKTLGVAEGKALGVAEGKALAILRVLEKRGMHVTDEKKRCIVSCTDLATLDGWLDAAITATSIDELLG